MTSEAHQATVLYETRDHIAYITLNRPEQLNAINRRMAEELEAAWYRFDADADAWVAILTGNGERALCSGRDLCQYGPTDAEAAGQPSRRLGVGIEVFKPIIAGVHGYCLAAGLDPIPQADIRVAANDASFGMTMTRWGVMAATGASQLPRAIHWNQALELLLTAERIDAREAYGLGLVNRVVLRDQLLAACEEYAAKIMRNSPTAVRLTKEAAVRGRDAATLAESLGIGKSLQRYMRTTADASEGPRAFAEKREPRWQPEDVRSR